MHTGRMWSFQNTWGNGERPLEGPEHPGCAQWHTARLSAPHKKTCKPLPLLQTDTQSRPPLGTDILVLHILANPILSQLNVPQRDRSQDSKLQRSLVLVQKIIIPVQISLVRQTDPSKTLAPTCRVGLCTKKPSPAPAATPTPHPSCESVKGNAGALRD